MAKVYSIIVSDNNGHIITNGVFDYKSVLEIRLKTWLMEFFNERTLGDEEISANEYANGIIDELNLSDTAYDEMFDLRFTKSKLTVGEFK